MIQSTRDAMRQYEDLYTRHAKLKKEHKLFPGDTEPDPKAFGILPWAAEHIRKRVDREVNR